MLAFREPGQNGGDLYVYSSAWLAYGCGRRVGGAWRPSSMKGAVVESREQVEPKDETEPVEDLEVDADQAASVAGGLNGNGIIGGGGGVQGPPRP